MGTSTLFRRYNDLRGRLSNMPKEELRKIDGLSPWKDEKEVVGGWSVIMELHNGDVIPLVWWRGRLFRLRDAPSILTERHYNRYTGKFTPAAEWTLLKRYLEAELERLDKEYKRARARQYRAKPKSRS